MNINIEIDEFFSCFRRLSDDMIDDTTITKKNNALLFIKNGKYILNKELKYFMKNITEEKNKDLIEMPDIDISGILPNFKLEVNFKAMREYCKKKDIELRDLTDEETEQFLIND